MVIPGYKLGREIQACQDCTTYNALDVEHSKTVVVRVFSEALSKDPAFQHHFREITDRLVDQPLPHNVDYLDAIVTDNACVIVTNYCPRSSLRQQEFPDFSEGKVLEIGAQLAASLSQLHNLGIAHGAVELSNISFLDNGDVVLDTVAPQRTMPGYDVPQLVSQGLQDAAGLAPEASTGLTVSSDFFSLGVVLFELLLGRKPFNADSMAEMEQQKRAGKYLPLPGDLAHLKPLFDGLLAPDPKSRIASSEHFVSVVDACRMGSAETDHAGRENLANTEPAVVTAQPAPVAPERRTGRRPIAFAAVAAVVVTVAFGFLMVSGKPEAPQSAQNETRSPRVAEAYAPVVDAPPPAQRSREQTEANGFFASAMLLVQEGKYQAALQAVDRGLDVEPDNVAAQNLRNEIEQELKARSDAAAAEQASRDKTMVKPSEDGAVETRPRVAEAAPERDDREANASALEAKRRAERERAEQQRAAEFARQQRLERERIARAEEAERLAAQQREIAARNAEINQRLANVEQHLTGRPLSLSTLEAAESEYRVLANIANNDSRVSDLYRRIVNAHIALATRQMNAAQLSESMESVDRGLALDRGNQKLLALRVEVANAIRESEEEDEIPIIGTF
jgi:hypothetical protein